MEYLTGWVLEALRFFYSVGGHNAGLAIIWLTVAANIALYPLTLSSTVQMAAMQRIQPRLQELQKKYKDDPKKLQKEMMDAYKAEGVNPLGGCLPVLLKIPVFLALFFALQSKEFSLMLGQNVMFIPGWIVDITKHDPFYLLPALIGLTTWLMQKSMPTTGGQAQAMTYFMPIFIIFVSFNFAAGIQLYWVVSNLMGWLQQAYIMRHKVTRREQL